MRPLLLGTLGSTLLIGVIGAAFVLRQEPAHQRSTTDSALYDACLVEKNGNIVVCDALMRIVERERDIEEVMIEEAARLRAAGFSKREVAEWAAKKGFKVDK